MFTTYRNWTFQNQVKMAEPEQEVAMEEEMAQVAGSAIVASLEEPGVPHPPVAGMMAILHDKASL
ncbi:hypothetical protein GN244_ATG12536 [Phytophthora infestans]|uniref:Uncharacterized protein n=1 Tax=Phytophthora infestans TaxID=4787 RepID=A0A833WB14_PHYIN|nr:hypothetical protein GN244_ATG12536 [Phytophthora infestans]KAF4142746.1 hypothetical protein GN958_ATG08058 [Phytophthora infestans]